MLVVEKGYSFEKKFASFQKSEFKKICLLWDMCGTKLRAEHAW